MEFNRRVFNSTNGLSEPGQGVGKVEINHGKVQINPPEKFGPYFISIPRAQCFAAKQDLQPVHKKCIEWFYIFGKVITMIKMANEPRRSGNLRNR